MRIFQLLVLACGMVLLLTACDSSTSDTADNGASSSGRTVVREGRSSAENVSAASVSSSAASAHGTSSAPAPFFSQNRTSSSAASIPAATFSSASAFDSSSSLSADTSVLASRVKLFVEADRTEVRPGDSITLVVTVKNISSSTIANMQVVTSYVPGQLVVAETAGAQAGNAVWTIESLEPDQKRVLRIPVTVAATLAEGGLIRTNTIVAINNVVEPQAYPYQLSIVTQLPLPHTGAGDATSPLENTRRFLTPLRAGSSIPLVVWTAVVVMGIALGSSMSKRLW